MIYLILLLALVLRLWNINQSLWLDEAAQAIESRHAVDVILRNMPADFHPPFFHLLTHYWLKLGEAEWVMRMLPVLLGLGSVVFTYLLAKELFGRKVALISSLFLAINPFHIYYSQELRPYMAGVFFAAASTYFLWKRITGNFKWWVAYTGTVTAFFYTSYFAPFLIFGQFIFLLTSKVYRPKMTSFLISLAVTVGLFLPWVPQISSQLRISSSLAQDLPGWKDAVASPVVKSLPLTLVKFIIGQINFDPLYFYGLVAGVIVGVWGWIILRAHNFKSAAWRYPFILFVLGLIIPIAFSLYLQIASPKRLMYVLPFFVILLAYGLSKFKAFYFKAVLTLLIALNSVFLLIYQTNPYFQREDWRGATGKVERLATAKSVTLFKFSEPFAPFVWYSKENLKAYGLSERLFLGDEPLTAKLNNLTKDADQVFLFQYIEGLTDPKRVTDEALLKLGFSKKDTYDFPGVGLVHEYIR